jgi:sugar lactone lactonase YvrE
MPMAAPLASDLLVPMMDYCTQNHVMRRRRMGDGNQGKMTAILALLLAFAASGTLAGDEMIPFDSDRWDIQAGRVVEYLGQTAFTGRALLKGVDFQNGVIEVDIACDGSRAFAGLLFRVQSNENLENFYVRPHKSNLPDALQYQPVINGSSTWQIYSDEGFTAAATIPHKSWFHVKMEISGTQARVFLHNEDRPSLIITDLKHGASKGTIGVSGPPNGSAHFANFRYRLDDELDFEAPPRFESPYGMVTDWQLSQSFKISEVDLEQYPDAKLRETIEWKPVKTDVSGHVNVSRYISRVGNEPDVVFAKTTLHSAEDAAKKLAIGYSDVVTVYLNGEILFTGLSEFRRRDPTFIGVMGLNDIIYLPLKKGENELLLSVAESFGGWGFTARDGDAVYHHDGVTKIWETSKNFDFPESALYDPDLNVVYVTNYDAYNPSGPEGKQSISKLSLEGDIVEREWVRGLKNPTGMVIHGDELYVVERDAICVIERRSGQIADRHPLQGIRFANDIAVTPAGEIYFSDSGANAIFKLTNGELEPWLKSDAVGGPNGLAFHDNRLIVGASADHTLKSVDLKTKEIRTIVRFGKGIMDGIKIDKDGNYLISHWEGRLYRVTPAGEVTKLLDTSAPDVKCADFDYIADHDMVIVPTMDGGRVKAYRLGLSKKTTGN